jgi:hypothetical protein
LPCYVMSNFGGYCFVELLLPRLKPLPT